MPAESARPTSVAALAWALLGLATSLYLTIEHFTTTVVLACPESATINCAKVTASPWSTVAGVPVAVIGLAYFVAVTGLCLPRYWRDRRLDPVRLAAAGAGAVGVVYLVWVELFRVDAICLWCTVVHVCTVALLVVISYSHLAKT